MLWHHGLHNPDSSLFQELNEFRVQAPAMFASLPGSRVLLSEGAVAWGPNQACLGFQKLSKVLVQAPAMVALQIGWGMRS